MTGRNAERVVVRARLEQRGRLTALVFTEPSEGYCVLSWYHFAAPVLVQTPNGVIDGMYLRSFGVN